VGQENNESEELKTVSVWRWR